MIKSTLQKFPDLFKDDTDELLPSRNDSGNGKINFYSSNQKIFNIFFGIIAVQSFITMLVMILYYVFAYASLANGSHAFDWLLGIFSDFAVIMQFSLEESPYIVGDSSYPPIAIAILYPFALICKDIFAMYAHTEMTADELTSKLIIHPEFWISIVLFFVICSTLILVLLIKLFGLTGKNIFKMSLITLASAPFVYTIMRGNTIYFALIFLLLFLVLKDSKNPFAREISYICLALSGSIKIYPLFFGVFLLKDKKFFASLRVAIYFALLFICSFFTFKEGTDFVDPFFDNLIGFMNNEERLLATNNLSVSALLFKFIHLFVPKLSSETTVFTVINFTVLSAVFIIATYSAIFTKSNFTRYTVCFATIILIPTISYFYVNIFVILPFLEYIKDYRNMGFKKRIFYFFSFAFLFIILFVLPKDYTLHSFLILTILGIEFVSVIKERKALRKLKTA